MTSSATMSSTITSVSRKVRTRGVAPPTSVRMPRAKAVSVPMAMPQPRAVESPALMAR
jgi:hypothetical protein